MKKFYFTFGSDKHFPYWNGYIEIVATSKKEAEEHFMTLFPCRHEGVLNCAFVYNQAEWNRNNMEKFYSEPFDVFFAKKYPLKYETYMIEGDSYLSISTDLSRKAGVLHFTHEISLVFKITDDRLLFEEGYHIGVEDYDFESVDEVMATYPGMYEQILDEYGEMEFEEI